MSIEKTYVCFQSEEEAICRIDTAYESILLPRRLDLRRISSGEISWGSRSVGQAQLSLAIVADHFSGSMDGSPSFAGDAISLVMYQYFNYVFLSNQSPRGFTVTTEQLQQIFHKTFQSNEATFLNGLKRAFSKCVNDSLFDFASKPTQPLKSFHEFRQGFAKALVVGLGMSEKSAQETLNAAHINASYEDFGRPN